MEEPKRFDPNKIENFLKNSAGKNQILSYWNAAVDHGKTIREIGEKLHDDNDDKPKAELLLRRKNTAQKRERLVQAVQNAMKVKYQPQIPEAFAYENKEMWSRFEELQQQNSSIGRLAILMSAMCDESEIQNYLDPEEKKRAVDETMVSNKKLRKEAIANGEDTNGDDYTSACQEMFQIRSVINKN